MERREKIGRPRKKGRFSCPELLLGCVFFLLSVLTACGDEDGGAKVIFTTGLGKDEVFRIGGSICTEPEMVVYLTNTQNQYENVYGSEVWNVSRDGVTLEENVKDTVLAKMAQIKTMYLLAQDRGVALEDGENKRVKQAAEEYFDSLTEREKELMGVKLSTIEQLYKEYALADKVYHYIIQDVNPEISDDEARTITVQHILLRIPAEDGQAESEEQKRAAYEKALEIRRMAVEDGEDFLDLASRYSEDSVITYSFGKGEMDPVFEEAAFSLETDEVSQVIETKAGYHIIKCISTFDREQTDMNKLTIVEERRREVFGQEYDAFVVTLARQLNTELWDSIKLLHDEEVTTADFFDIYAKYFPDKTV
ncbi:MAG: peptidylprolyl isomerase [Lachnospiraceae bacterium]|jgi:foldase protein PrsA|nr:peptidylprolyl isomerase [Lachnospiraceae bacterium]